MGPAARFGAALLPLAIAACGADPPKPAPPVVAPAPQTAAPAAAPRPVFVDVAAEAGITAINHSGKPSQKDWMVSGNGGGAIVLDYDQDGRMDLVVVDGTMLTSEGELQYSDDARTRLYHNDGGMRFTETTKKAGVDIQAFGMGGASCDYDGDGFPDFYVCCWGPNFLMKNRGDGTFVDVAAKAGVRGGDDKWSNGCAFGDVDGDGVIDLYVANYCDQRAFIKKCLAEHLPPRHTHWRSALVYAGPNGLVPQKDSLYFGNGDGTFRDVTDTNLGPQNPPSYGYQPIMTDVDNDGDLDIYVTNDTRANYLWINDGHGRFTDQGVDAGVAFDFDSKAQASMGVDAADVNRDGWIDLFVTNLDFDHNTIYVNQTGAAKRTSFRDLSNAYNVAAPSYHHVSWGTRFVDYDNDGNLDLFVACGHVYGESDDFEKITGASYRQRCLLERSRGAPSFAFEDVTDAAGPAFEIKRVWRGAAFADFDDDGDLDVFVTALNEAPALFRNDGGNRNNFLVFRLIGKGKLRDPCGARVTIWPADGRPHMEELHHGASFCSDNDPRLFFGLGQETSVKRVDVRWPGGEMQTFADVAGRKFYVAEQGKSELREDKR